MQAFVKAFGDNTDVQLLLKARKGVLEHDILNENIDIIQKDMTADELYELYLSTEVLVNPNMGEGFGLIPREYAATGGIAIATDWGGTADDIADWGLPIPYHLVPAWKGHKHEGLGYWAMPDVESLADLMVSSYEHYDRLADVGDIRAQRVRQLYSWEAFAKGILEIWNGITNTAHQVQSGRGGRRNGVQR